MADAESPVCAEGARFECFQCGNCCSGSPGYVRFSPEESERMAAHLGIDVDEFLRRYARKRGGRWSLKEIETEGGYDCVFLARDAETGSARCSIYPVRPEQCRTWPFWPENLKSPEAWESAAEGCPGMRRLGQTQRRGL